MINKIISFSIKNKLFIGIMTVALIVAGIYSMTKIPLDAVPDISNNQVQVITVAPNLGTEDIEQFVTYQVELSMSNLPGVIEIRSISRFGLSVVTIVFEDDLGTYLPRQLVSEALSEVKESIPKGFGEPFMSPISTGLGEIYQYTLEVDSSHKSLYTAMDLRTMQDWIVKRQMAMLSGVVEVNSFGGSAKQYEVSINPDKLRSMNVSMSEIFEALEKNNQNTGGAYIEKNHQANYIRGEGLVRSKKDIENVFVKTIDGAPLYIRDIADVEFGSSVRYGAFTRNGEGEAVGGIVMMLKGENSNKVINDVKERVSLIQKSLPEGVSIVPFLDRSEMIKSTTSTVAENLSLGALIVIFILVIILGNFRGGIIVATTIPLSLLFAFIMMRFFGVWANLMSLGAIDFGILIDGAVIIVESMIFYLHDKKFVGIKLIQKQKDELAYKASSKMMNSAFFGQIIIMIVFVPLLALQGVEGKMFGPMAMTFGFAVLGVVILCLTYIPMMTALLLKAPKTLKKSFGDKIVEKLENFYRPILSWALGKSKLVLSTALILLVVAGFTFSKLGGEFMPQLDEGNLAMHILLKPGTSLTDVIETSTKVEKKLINSFPDEIESIQTRIGVADIPTDPMPIDIGDCFIILKPIDQWTVTQNKEELLVLFEEAVNTFSGVNYEFSQPVEMRFNELLTGVREDLAIKIYGEDLDVLAQKASEIESLVAGIDGVGDIKAEATQGLPQITIRYNRNKLGQYGLNISDLNKLIETAFSGSTAGVIYEGEKRFDLVVRLDKEHRKSIDDIKNLYVDVPNGSQVPLNAVADISYQPGPMQISRDNTNRRTYVGINVRGRDVKSLVEEIQQKLDSELDLPAGYYIRYGGAFENLERATDRLLVVVPLALILIFLLVFIAVKSFKQALMIYMAIPLAAVGGVFSLYLRGMPFSISAGVGFIVLFGVAVMNGLVLVSSFNELKEEGETSLKDIILKGSVRRVRAILLTASTDVLGFLPMAISASAGAEVQRPLATVVIGGMLTATVLTLVVIPVLYQWVETSKGKFRLPKVKPQFAAIILVVVGLSIPGVMKAQETQFTLEQVVDKAIENYPAIKAAQLEVQKQEALKGSVYDLGSTSFYTGKEEIKNGNYGVYNQIGIAQSDIDIFGIPAKNKLVNAHINQANAGLELTEKMVVREVSLAWYKAVYSKQELELYLKLDSLYNNFLKAAELRYKTQQTSKIEYLSAASKYSELQVNIKVAESNYLASLQSLNQYLLYKEKFGVQMSNLNNNLFVPNDSLLKSPILDFYSTTVEVAEKQWKAEQTSYFPKLDFGYSIQNVDGVSGYNSWEAGISIPLIFFSQASKTKASRINYQIVGLEFEQKKLEVQSEYNQLLSRFYNHYEIINYYVTNALPLANEQMSASLLAYKLGSIDYIQFIQNVNGAISIKNEYLKMQNIYFELSTELKYLSGKI